MPKNGRELFSSPAGRSWLSAKDPVEPSLSVLYNDRAKSTAASSRRTGGRLGKELPGVGIHRQDMQEPHGIVTTHRSIPPASGAGREIPELGLSPMPLRSGSETSSGGRTLEHDLAVEL